MNLKTFILIGGVGFALHGCTSLDHLNVDSFKSYALPQELITQKKLNGQNGDAQEYIYSWGAHGGDKEVQSLYPKKYLSAYCAAKGGKFSPVYKSSMSLVKDHWAKKLLTTYSSVKQGIGAYRCVQSDGQNWIVSIEPVAERKLDEANETRVVKLQTRIMSLDESKKFYENIGVANNGVAKKKSNNNQVVKAVTAPVVEKAVPLKNIEAKKEIKQIPELPIKQPEKVIETPQQQQLKAYVVARRDLANGKNQVNACNNAQYAYNLGKLQNAGGTNVYAESGVLVARCLINVPSYSSRFSNPKARAKTILQSLASNQNHAGAKHLLNQIK